MSLADRFLGGCYPYTVQRPLIGQNKDRHKTALDPKTLVVNTKKLGALSEPSFLR